MRLALAEAEHATLTGDVPVGAVVLSADGAVLARAHNEREASGDPTAHAEVLAVRRAAAALRERSAPAGPDGRPGQHPGAPPQGADWRLSGCTLVVTLEPCTMCAGAIVLSRLDRVVYGAPDPKAGAAGSLWDLVRDRRLNHRPEVVANVLPGQAAALLTRFFRPEDF
jgi:tRNA(adenine34) deaminase